MTSVEPSGVVTLLTDFGLADPFVGVMKGAIYKRYKDARIVDLTHAIEPQDVLTAAFWIDASYRYFPEGTVHVVVVDPGVGTARRPLLVSAHRHYFVGPDNGVFSRVLRSEVGREVRVIDLARLGVEELSDTFHGRDIFAPAAGELASGYRWAPELGTLLREWVSLDLPRPELQDGRLVGSVLTVDRFGNLMTNISRRRVAEHPGSRVRIGGLEMEISRTYGDVGVGEPLALINAFDALEIAVREGSAATQLGLGRGAEVELLLSSADRG